MVLNGLDLISMIQIREDTLGERQILKLIERLRAERHRVIITEGQAEIIIASRSLPKQQKSC